MTQEINKIREEKGFEPLEHDNTLQDRVYQHAKALAGGAAPREPMALKVQFMQGLIDFESSDQYVFIESYKGEKDEFAEVNLALNLENDGDSKRT